MKPVKFRLKAENEMINAKNYYNVQLDDLGMDFIDEVEKSIELIQKSPTRWAIIEGNIHKYILQRFPFTIYYVNEVEEILILAIAHQSRKPGYWDNR